MTVTLENLHSKATQANTSMQFEALFREHWSRVYGVVFRIVGDPDEAEDLALETFMKLYHTMESPAGIRVFHFGRSKNTNLGGWLYRVATNLGLNALRARKRREHYELEAGMDTLQINSPQNPAQKVERAEEHQRVRLILSQMKPRAAKMLILRHTGLSYTEIASAVKVSPNSVGKLLSRAEKDFERRYRALEGN